MKEFFFKTYRYFIILLFCFIIGGYVVLTQKANYNNTITEKNKLLSALTDSVSYHKNIYGETVATKKTLQAKISELTNSNIILTNKQKELFNRINTVNKEKKVIAAALIETEIKLKNILDSINQSVVIDSNKISFSGNNEYFGYHMTIFDVKPIGSKNPVLGIDSLYFYNKQFINFHWDNNRKSDYPISFSVSNSNPYFFTSNIESYVIPTLKKDLVDPTGWMKVKNWFKNNWDNSLFFMGGVLIGSQL